MRYKVEVTKLEEAPPVDHEGPWSGRGSTVVFMQVVESPNLDAIIRAVNGISQRRKEDA